MNDSIFAEIEIDEETLQDCWNFAVQQSNNYRLRGQKDSIAIREQTAGGKVGEWVAYLALKDHFCELTTPDMDIYDSGSKGWTPDLFAGDLAFGVKSCSQITKRAFGQSYTFQYQDSRGYGMDKGIFSPDAADLILVFVELLERKVEGNKTQLYGGKISTLTTLYELRKHDLFAEPIKEELKKTKKVVYSDMMAYKGIRKGVIYPAVEKLIDQVQV